MSSYGQESEKSQVTDANIKQISKQLHFFAKPVRSIISIAKPIFKIVNFASTKPSTSVQATATGLRRSTVTKTYPGPIDVSITGREESI